MKKIILDTNFLLIPVQFKVDIFSELHRICDFKYQLCIVDKTIDELNKIIQSKAKLKDKTAAKIALQLIKKEGIKIIETNELNADDAIVSLAEKESIVVATQDKILRNRIKKTKSKIIILRQKQYLEMS